jgi:periplasmic copper chaperone A
LKTAGRHRRRGLSFSLGFSMSLLRVGAALAAAVVLSTAAQAHVSFEGLQGPAGGSYKAVLRVGHGCDGSPTTRIRVRIPEGVIDVKPQPKPGWELATTVGKLEKPYDAGHGRTVTEGVIEVSWSGGKLPDQHYDEFVMRLQLPDRPGAVVYFPVVQDCEKGVHRWIEIPAAGKKADDYKEPAPGVTLVPRAR